ncbi:MAG: sensor histidine kinase [Bacteroidota bacterium]
MKELEIPLSVKEERLGTLVLGPKKSDLPYHRMDTMLAKSLCQQFALWMKNAQLFLEVTHQQRLQLEALQQVDRMKDEFLSVVSHELRTPLNAVQGFGELLEREVLGPMNEEQQRAIGQILGGSDRILRLINDILDFTQIQSGAFGIFREPTDYLELVNEVVSLLAPLAEKKGIVIETDIAVESEILIDEQRIAQVLTNLVANAIKFMGEGKILIRAGFEGETLWTEVSDEGMGIPEDDLERIFAPFTQLDMSSTRREGGTGLGLSITHGIVEAHGGSIVALSPGPGQGSTFRFVIPTNSVS